MKFERLSRLQLRRIVHDALERTYGFAPSLNAIIVLEAKGNGTFIKARVNNRVYIYTLDSKYLSSNCKCFEMGHISRRNLYTPALEEILD